jgi:hypothetical protein
MNHSDRSDAMDVVARRYATSSMRERLTLDQPEPEQILRQSGLLFRKGWNWLALALLIATTIVLRLWMLGAKSLWLVEAFSVSVARMPWLAFLRTMWWGEANMVLYYVLLRGWLHLGNSEFWLRSLSVLFGVAAILAVYALGDRFLSRNAGFAAAVLLALNSFHIQYSQELRSYSLVTLLLILSAYAFLTVHETPERATPWILYVVFSALSIYAHIFAVFVIASQWLVLTPFRIKRLGMFRLLSAGAAIGILTAPIAAVVVLEHKEQLDWVPPLSVSGISEVLQDIVGTGAAPQGSVRSPILLTLYVVTLVLGLACFIRTRRNRTAEQTASVTMWLIVSWLAFPVVAMAGISLFKPILAPRYLLMCVPAVLLVVGWALVEIGDSVPWRGTVSVTLFLTMVALTAFGIRDYFASFKTYGHDGRAVTNYVLSHQGPGDAAIFYTFSEHYVFEYYLMREKGSGAASTSPVVFFPLALERANIEKRTAPYQRVWLVLHQTRRTQVTDAQTETIRAALETRFHLEGEREFSGHGVDRGESGLIRVLLFDAGPTGQKDAQ